MIGLDNDTVLLEEHQTMWEEAAAETVSLLKTILKGAAVDVQHVGSTSIRGISAKPIIDIAVGLNDTDDIKLFIPLLAENGIIYRKRFWEQHEFFVIGDLEKNIKTHHIHAVKWDGKDWNEYVNFRDYLNAMPEKAKQYNALKHQLAEKFCYDRVSYTDGKAEMIQILLKEAECWRKSKAVDQK